MHNYRLFLIIVLWINFIVTALPKRVIRTYTELLIGAIVSGSGHITQALLAVGHQRHYTTYYWLLENGRWSWLSIMRQLVTLIMRFFPRKQWHLIIDDFICPRVSHKAPHVKYHCEHSQKPNRPRYLWGQQWVALGLSLRWGKVIAALPLLLKLHKYVGNGTKLSTAVSLISQVAPLFRQQKEAIVRCLVDAWYMKAPFVLPLLQQGIHVIGQVRKDTVLFLQPSEASDKSRRRGRPRKYGVRLTEKALDRLALHHAELHVYGSLKHVTYRWSRCVARFLKGQLVIAVWCRLPGQSNWTLIISTDVSLTPERIIKLFARRWKIEPMFNEIKHQYGITQAWEQKNQTLHRWVSMICLAYSLTRLLALLAAAKSNQHAVPLIQWRKKQPITAGMMRLGLQLFFRQFTFLQLWDKKSKKLKL